MCINICSYPPHLKNITMIKCGYCFGTGSFKRKNKPESCKYCNGTGKIEPKPRKERRSNIPKLANQVPYFQVFGLKNVVANCCGNSVVFLSLKIDKPVVCECGIIEVVRIYEKMVDINIIPMKYTETILI